MKYTSPWLTHFVGARQPTDDARCCEVLVKILNECTLGQWEQQGAVLIDPGSMIVDGGSLCKDEFIRFRPACFCDIPEEALQRHTGIYGRFGLAFKKDYLVAKGANPVFYIAKGSVASHERPPVPPLTVGDLEADASTVLRNHFAALSAAEVPVRRCEFLDRLVMDLSKVLPPPWPPGTPGDARDPVREIQKRVLFDLISQVFAFTKFFDESLPEEHKENFYMEREWRVRGFVRFEHGDLQRVYVALGFQEKIRCEFPGLEPIISELTL